MSITVIVTCPEGRFIDVDVGSPVALGKDGSNKILLHGVNYRKLYQARQALGHDDFTELTIHACGDVRLAGGHYVSFHRVRADLFTTPFDGAGLMLEKEWP